jgi:hypothetical protein
MAGYSGTPLAKKLGIKPGARLQLLNTPLQFEAALGALPEGVERTVANTDQQADMVIAFHTSAAALSEAFPSHARSTKADGALWIAWPKRASGVSTDLNENLLRDIGLPTGMVDNKVCAIDETWSGLRFVVRKENRAEWPRK